MTENAAILAYLDKNYPGAALLPHYSDPVADNQGLIDLIWCSSTLHPMVRQVRMPIKFTSGEIDDIRKDGIAKLRHECAMMSERVGSRWWYGDSWSIIDAYIYWGYSTAEVGGFPLKDYPALVAHAERVQARPSAQRTRAREIAAAERKDALNL